MSVKRIQPMRIQSIKASIKVSTDESISSGFLLLLYYYSSCSIIHMV